MIVECDHPSSMSLENHDMLLRIRILQASIILSLSALTATQAGRNSTRWIKIWNL